MTAWPVDNPPSTRYPVYTRGNVGEVFPAVVSPLTWSAYGGQAELGWRDAFRKMGALLDRDFGDEPMGILGVFGGYCYLNVSYVRVFAVRTPGLTPDDMDRQLFGESDAPPYDPQPGDRDRMASLRMAATIVRTLLARKLPHLDADKELVAGWVGSLPPVATASDAELVDIVRSFGPLFRHLFKHHILTSFQALIGGGLVTQLCAETLGDPSLMVKLIAGIGEVESAGPSFAMWELSRLAPGSPEFERAFARFVGEFGSRGPNEWEGSSETWETNPALAMAAIDCMRPAAPDHAPLSQQGRLEAERVAATAAARSRLRGGKRLQFDRALRSVQLFLQGRERSKTTVIRALHGVRLAQRELARRARERGGPDDLAELWLVTLDELPDYVAVPGGFASVVTERRVLRDRLASLVPPFVFAGTQPPIDSWARRDAAGAATAVPGTVLSGIAGCPGVARGRARVVLDPLDPRGLGPGEVLIAPITDPSWTPLFVPAEAVVVDVGAQMSHAVIVSRELGIPAVVSVTGATAVIPDGAMVEVDGNRGTVTVLELATPP